VQVEAAASAARRAAHPQQKTLPLRFLSGCEPEWLPAVMHVLREELPKSRSQFPASTPHNSPRALLLGSWTRLLCDLR
jgi:hypothetical protein